MDNLINILPENWLAEYLFRVYLTEDDWEKWGRKELSEYQVEQELYKTCEDFLSYYQVPTDYQIMSNICYIVDFLQNEESKIMEIGGYNVYESPSTSELIKDMEAIKSFINLVIEQDKAYKAAHEKWSSILQNSEREEDVPPAPDLPYYSITFNSYGKSPKSVHIKEYAATYMLNLIRESPKSPHLYQTNISKHSNEKVITRFLKNTIVALDKILIRLDFTFHTKKLKYWFIQGILQMSNVNLDEVTTDIDKYFNQLENRARKEGLFSQVPNP